MLDCRVVHVDLNFFFNSRSFLAREKNRNVFFNPIHVVLWIWIQNESVF